MVLERNEMEWTVESVVDEVCRIADSQFTDFHFLDPGGALELTPNVERVRAVRVELPGRSFLHLASVLPEVDGIDDLYAATCRSTSSTWKSYDRTLQDGLLFDHENRTTAFHTKEENRPWLHIEFEKSVTLYRILLRNRPNDGAARARGIQVSCMLETGRWVTIYDGLERERELLKATQDIYGPVSEKAPPAQGDTGSTAHSTSIESTSRSVSAALVRILNALQVRDHQTIVRDLAAVETSQENKRRFRQRVNTAMLRARRLEWTSHGVRRSFRFWSPSEKSQYVAYAQSVVDDLSEFTDNVCLGFGSVLAAVRDNDLIPHDDDLDIIVGLDADRAATIREGLAQVSEFLVRKGHTVTGEKYYAHRFVSRRAMKKVDVFVGLFENNRIGWYPAARAAMPREIVFPPRSFPLLGNTCKIPRNPKEYLAELYGPDWHVPDPHFKHSAEQAAYKDIAR